MIFILLFKQNFVILRDVAITTFQELTYCDRLLEYGSRLSDGRNEGGIGSNAFRQLVTYRSKKKYVLNIVEVI